MSYNYHGQASFTISSWEELPYFKQDDMPCLSRATVKKSYSGGFVGEGHVEYLLVHYPNGTAEFTGHERIECLIDGKKGSFILRHDGTYETIDGQQTASAACFIVADSGTGDLVNLSGAGHFTATERQALFMFEFDI